jgi:prepilin-type N-terminal cleavage/methylation domain-containing protein
MNGLHLEVTATPMARQAAARRAMTLLELSAVVFIIGLLGAMAASRYGGSTIADVDGQGFSRRLALDCSQARRRAIATGDNHLLQFAISGGEATQYAIYRRQGASTNLVDQVQAVPADVTVTTGGASNVEFTFTGEALTSYTITVQAPDRTWTVTVPQVTGKAFVQ